MTTPAPDLDTLVRQCAPDVPDGLRDRCVDAPRADADGLADETLRAARARTVRMRAVVLATGTVLTSAIVFSMAGSQSLSAAPMLDAALATLDEIDALSMTTTVDHGPDTEAIQTLEYWNVTGLGSRLEYVDQGYVEIYDEQDRRQATFDPAGDVLTLASIDDRMMRRELLSRADVDSNLTVLRALTLIDSGAVTIEPVEQDGRRRHRLRGIDESGHEIVADIDWEFGRVMQTATWTDTGDDLVRVVVTFDYPHPADVDPALFDPLSIDAQQVVQLDAHEEAVRQCMVNLRGLVIMTAAYSDEHDGRLPRSVRQLRPYAERPLEWYLTYHVPGVRQASSVEAHLDQDGARFFDLDPAVILFEGTFGTQRIAGFADGHVEVMER